MVNMSSIFSVPMLISCLSYCEMVLQEISIEGTWVKDIQDHTILFLKTTCIYTVILKFNLLKIKFWRGRFVLIFYPNLCEK